jgi:putative protease
LGFAPNPDKTFNRGYSTYFLTGRGAEVASPDSPKHVGEPLGHVAALGRDSFTLDGASPLQSGDGITFYGPSAELEGSTVNRVQGKIVFPQKLDGLAAGARVFRNHDHAFAKQIAQSRPVRKIAVALKLSETAEGISLEATDEDGVRAETTMICEKATADKPERAEASVEQQLAKLGDTEFTADSITLDWTTPLHLPASQVNSLRRQLAEDLTAARAQARPRQDKVIVVNDAPYPASKLSYLANVLNQKAAAFYRRHQVRDIEPAAESGLDLAGRTVMTTRTCLKYELGCCPHGKKLTTEVKKIRPPEPWFLVDDEGRRLRLRFRCEERHCVMEVVYSLVLACRSAT